MSEQPQTEQRTSQSVGSVRSVLVWVVAGVFIGVVVFAIASAFNQSAPPATPLPTLAATPVPIVAVSEQATALSTAAPVAAIATETPFVTYTVQSGDVLSAIAERFSVYASEIHEANGEPLANPDRLQIGQELRIPFSGSQTPPPLPTRTPLPTAEPITPSPKQKRIQHIVKRGEVLSTLALKYGVTVQALRTANNLRSDVIRVGDTLIIPAPANTRPTATASSR